MAFNIGGAIEVPLSTFGSLITAMSPSDVPEGCSPDCQDVLFAPGNVASRPGLQKVFSSPFSGAPKYEKTFIDSKGVVRNLYLDSAGALWMEDVTNSPGARTQIFQAAAGSFAKSVTAFGNEYIAFSDGLHGSDIAIQYDGTTVARVTQDGPGASPTVTNISLSAVTTSASGAGPSYTVTTINTSDPDTYTTGSGGYPYGPPPTTVTYYTSITIGLTLPPVGVVVGSVVTISGNTNAAFNATWTISAILPSNFIKASAYFANSASGTGGSLATGASGVTATRRGGVVSIGTATAHNLRPGFRVDISGLGAGWDGTFYVSTVGSSTTFTYAQAGPNATTSSVGTVTPNGQIAIGAHQLQVMFLTAAGYITKPSPAVKFVAPGGQFVSVSNIPIGPANVVARVLAFTGAEGSTFYYLPVPDVVAGQIVSTATQIGDNTTTSTILDFSDNSLLDATGVSIAGNNVAAQLVLDGALGFASYDTRLITWGQRNRILNMQNMGFDGGYLPTAPNLPAGWISNGDPGGSLGTGHYGQAWVINVSPGGARYGTIYQYCGFDAAEARVFTPNTRYRFRCWIQATVSDPGLNVQAYFGGGAVGSPISKVIINGANISTAGGWVDLAFDLTSPASITSDFLFAITATSASASVTLTIDDMSIIYADNPYEDSALFASYINNPEAFDGVTGKFGPANDPRKVMALGEIRNTLYLFTQDPAGRVHQTTANGVTEPVGWDVEPVASAEASSGALSAFCVAEGAFGLAWASFSGARVFGGDQPWKITAEIQPDWDAINPAARVTVWAFNDQDATQLYFGLPVNGATAPNRIYTCFYRGLDTAYQIGAGGPVRAYGGDYIVTDDSRKWTFWNLASNGGCRMLRTAGGKLEPVLMGAGSHANVYTLNLAKLTDDDYGAIPSWYTTYYFTGDRNAQMQRLGMHQKTIAYLTAFVSGLGNLSIVPLVNAPTHAWPITATIPLAADPENSVEWGGGAAKGQRIAFKFRPVPATGTDCKFSLSRMVVAMRAEARLPVRGAA